MYPNSTPYNPYAFPSFPVPNAFGQFPPVLSCNGMLFTRRDQSQPPTSAPSIPPFQQFQAAQQAQNNLRSHTPVQSNSKSPVIINPKASEKAPNQKTPSPRAVTSVSPADQQVALSRYNVAQSPQSVAKPSQTQLQPTQQHGGLSNTIQYVAPPFLAPQQQPTLPALQPPFLLQQQPVPPALQPPFLNQHQTTGTASIHPQFPSQPQPLQPPFLTPPLKAAAAGHNPPHWPNGQSLQGYVPIPSHLKHKCGLCGRSRSSQYHYEHPLQPGLPPHVGVCTRCKKKHSHCHDDEEASSHTEEDLKSPRYKSILHRLGLGAPRSPPPHRSRATRSKTRMDHKRKTHERERSRSTSSGRDRGHGPHYAPQHRSSSVEVVRLIETPKSHVRTKQVRTVYVESASCNEDDEIPYRNHQHHHVNGSRSERTESQVQTPVPHMSHREKSNPAMRSSRTTSDRRDYFHGFPNYATYQEYAHQSHPASPAHQGYQAHHPQSRAPQSHAVGTVYSQDDTSDRVTRSRSYGLDRHNIYDGEADGEDIVEVYEVLSNPPSPPIVLRERRSRSATAQTDRYNGKGPRVNARASVEPEYRTRATTTHHEGKAKDDYDWYDNHGMRVRVREI